MSKNTQLNIVNCPACSQQFIPEDTPDATQTDSGIWVCSQACEQQISDVDVKKAKDKETFTVWYKPAIGKLTIEDGVEQATQNTSSGLISKTRRKLNDKYGQGWRDKFWKNSSKSKVGTVIASHDGYLDKVVVE